MRQILDFYVKNDTLIPAGDEAKKFLQKKVVKGEREVFLTEYRYRILKHHRKFFAIIKKFIDNFDDALDVEDVLIYLKLKTGLYKKINFKGQEVIIPSSISFLEMDQMEFEDFYKKSVKILADALGVSVWKLEKEGEDV